MDIRQKSKKEILDIRKKNKTRQASPLMRNLKSANLIAFYTLILLLSACAVPTRQPVRPVVPVVIPDYTNLAQQVEIIRTDYGVPHIQGDNLKAMAFGMAWCQMEDYGATVAESLVAARGIASKVFKNPDLIESDFWHKRSYNRAVETYHLLHQDTRDMLEGFAAGATAYIQSQPEEFVEWPALVFTGHDVSALTIGGPNRRLIQRFKRELSQQEEDSVALEAGTNEDGSNSWAFAPSRTTTGNAILLRNPHLSWEAGYYEAHLMVPGVIDFYGDIRIGGAFAIIGGFNRRLGWATTNNAPDLDEIYELTLDRSQPDHFLFDGISIAIRHVPVEIEYINENGRLAFEVRDHLETPIGPVFHRTESSIFVMRSSNDGEYRRGEQYLRMMQANNLEEWKVAMRMQAIGSSNYTYADADGNILYVWNAKLPELPHESQEIKPIQAKHSSDIWTHLVPWDELPQVLNPEGGYVQNSNDPPYFTNLNTYLNPAEYPMHLPKSRLRLRTQLSLQLIHTEAKLSLEDVVALKHNMKMLLADRVKDDLVSAVRAGEPTAEVLEAIRLIENWDNTVSAESKGSVLFETWWQEYVRALKEIVTSDESQTPPQGDDYYFLYPWSENEPMETPRGLAFPELAAEVFPRSMESVRSRWGRWDITWGEVHRVRRGKVNVPVGGGSGGLGCFRVLSFSTAEDGKRVANSGDGWVLVVEFSDPPRAYSVLAYGQSNREESPHFDDQAEMFARNEMKPVAFTPQEIRDNSIRRYHPDIRLDIRTPRSDR